jgi:hypothetical protein
MPRFSKISLAQLETCDARLQNIAKDAIAYVDFTITEGHRNREKQEEAFRKGNTKLHWPKGNHNKLPSRAFDFAPWPVDWADKTTAVARFAFVAGVLLVCAARRGVKIRFGWDWNRNLDPRDESFLDWPHVELDEP